MSIRAARSIGYKRISDDVTQAFADLLLETGRLKGSRRPNDTARIPCAWAPQGWGERTGASWAGFLKLVEQRLYSKRPEYRVLHVTATDGHRTWRVPLSVSIHLLTEKIKAGLLAQQGSG